MVVLRSLAPPSEGVRLEQADTQAVLDGRPLGQGRLYVAETRLWWFDSAGLGFSLEYPSISLHAISRDPSSYPQEHLYVMVNAKLNDENEAEMPENAQDKEDEDQSSGDEDGGDDEDSQISEIRFVPSDKAALESMFSAMCECQALHPDPEDEDSENDFEGDEEEEEEGDLVQGDIPSFYTCEEALSSLTEEGQATLNRLEGMLAQTSHSFHMAGVRTDADQPNGDFDDGMEVEAGSTVAGQFEDADVDH